MRRFFSIEAERPMCGNKEVGRIPCSAGEQHGNVSNVGRSIDAILSGMQVGAHATIFFMLLGRASRCRPMKKVTVSLDYACPGFSFGSIKQGVYIMQKQVFFFVRYNGVQVMYEVQEQSSGEVWRLCVNKHLVDALYDDDGNYINERVCSAIEGVLALHNISVDATYVYGADYVRYFITINQ